MYYIAELSSQKYYGRATVSLKSAWKPCRAQTLMGAKRAAVTTFGPKAGLAVGYASELNVAVIVRAVRECGKRWQDSFSVSEVFVSRDEYA